MLCCVVVRCYAAGCGGLLYGANALCFVVLMRGVMRCDVVWYCVMI